MKVAIVGAGKLGYKLAETLLNTDNYVIIIDKNEKVLERINEQLDVLTIKANGLQMESLNELDISS
ncbi:MAG TPA: NAD(P)-binding domain-containing protein, partial [Clostridiales bacterium]|nr:NAD(P)-binding domain-containing protein [Clostridiales bacterium]